ncbi:MAG: hypothetical protein G01um101429_48 [Parcubacteria group bacterium Gr01-1014_29]|nr:MAG: hypothetical protein G01um101429_48 [Parcubacteria group bacterium Gr01-1014_29]
MEKLNKSLEVLLKIINPSRLPKLIRHRVSNQLCISICQKSKKEFIGITKAKIIW